MILKAPTAHEGEPLDDRPDGTSATRLDRWSGGCWVAAGLLLLIGSSPHLDVFETTLPNTALNAPYEGVDHGVDPLARFRSAQMLPEGFPYRSAGSTMIDWEL